jgi:hypothetical protein
MNDNQQMLPNAKSIAYEIDICSRNMVQKQHFIIRLLNDEGRTSIFVESGGKGGTPKNSV